MLVADVYWVHRKIWVMSCLFFLQFVLRNMFFYFLPLACCSPSFYHLSPSMMTLSLLFAFLFSSPVIELSLQQCSILYYQAVIPRVMHYLLVFSFHNLWGKVQILCCSSTGPCTEDSCMFHVGLGAC